MRNNICGILWILAIVGSIGCIFSYCIDCYDATTFFGVLSAFSFWGAIWESSREVMNAKGNGHYPLYD